MKVGLSSLVQNLQQPALDGSRIQDDLELALSAEGLGFDSTWAVEHHFSSYSMQPNPLLWLTYLAARTETIALGSMAVIMPWHSPARLVGEISMFDHLCSGRYVAGIGRGLGRLEFDGLNVPMEQSRSLFDEGTEILLQAMDSGTVQLDGEVITQPRRELRPWPLRSLRDRLFVTAVSPESMATAARFGAGLIINPQKPWDHIAMDIATYRDEYKKHHQVDAPRPIVAGQVYCHEDSRVAEEVARREMGEYYATVLAHYEMTGDHFSGTAGYEYYETLSQNLQSLQHDKTIDFYLNLQVFGTPSECVDKIKHIREVTGTDHFVGTFSYARLGREASHESAKLFAREVLPVLHRMESSSVATDAGAARG